MVAVFYFTMMPLLSSTATRKNKIKLEENEEKHTHSI